MYLKNNKFWGFALLLLLSSSAVNAQIKQKVGSNSMTIAPSAVFEIESTTKGFLPPRMTNAQRNLIVSVPAGLMIFCTDCGTTGEPQFFNGAQWLSMSIASATAYANTAISSTGRIWMDKNLGASQVATSSTDAAAYGDLYQWGRGADGHQLRTSTTTTTLSSSDQPGNANFIVAANSPNDWRSTQNGTLWQGVNGVNNPCPAGYRLPTSAEWDAERVAFNSNNALGAFTSGLKLTMGGNRSDLNGNIDYLGSSGKYWSSTLNGVLSNYLDIGDSNSFMWAFSRALGMSVRCTKNDDAAAPSGVAVVSGYTCGTGSGNMAAGVYASGVTQTITATVSSLGTYNISTTTVNGVKFTGSGTYTNIGNQTVILTASGTSTTTGTFTYAINGTPTCSFTRFSEAATPNIISAGTGRTWMDRNLGATQVATSSTDANSYGDLYQWGRGKDGHQLINRTTSQAVNGPTTTLSPGDVPGNGSFITNSTSPYDWRSTQNNDLWQGVNGTNNPCPTGFRLPTSAELSAEIGAFSSQNASGAFNSVLKLPVAGFRSASDGSLNDVGSFGYYWSRTVSGTSASYLGFYSSSASMGTRIRANGFSVRCLKD